MLADLPTVAVRYAALLNTVMAAHSADRRWVDWVRHSTGVYEQRGFTDLPWLVQHPFAASLAAMSMHEQIESIVSGNCRADYGVADNVAQVFAHYPYLTGSDTPYLVTVHTLTPATDPGWRWHKNGEYIGTQNPQREHLGDEPEITEVIAFDVWGLNGDVSVRDLAGPWSGAAGDWLTARTLGRHTRPYAPAEVTA